MKTIYKMIPAIFLLAVSVSMIATFNLNQVLAQNPSNLDPTVLKGAISGHSNNGNTTEPAWIMSGVYKFADVNASSSYIKRYFLYDQA